MYIYAYKLRSLDFVHFAKKGLVGDITPPYIHSTAINASLQTALGLRSEEHFATNNKPKYQELFNGKSIYASPARPLHITYQASGITCNHEKYTFTVEQSEILKYQSIKTIAPDSEWAGYLFSIEKLNDEMIIRLGRGKTPCSFTTEQKTILKEVHSSKSYVNHPVDPLHVKVIRGTVVSMFPYPIIEFPTVDGRIVQLDEKNRNIVAIPQSVSGFDS